MCLIDNLESIFSGGLRRRRRVCAGRGGDAVHCRVGADTELFTKDPVVQAVFLETPRAGA